MEKVTQTALFEALQLLQTTHEYSDLQIFCGDEVFQVHKAILCSRSDWFQKACKWGKDGKLKDEITLKDHDPKLIQLMIDYFYQLDYDDLPPIREKSDDDDLEPPESPIAKTIKHFETLSHEEVAVSEESEPVPVVQVENGLQGSSRDDDDDWRSAWRSPKKNKESSKRKRARRVQETSLITEEDPNHDSFGATSVRDTGKKSAKSLRHLRQTGLDTDTERLSTNARMYSLADEFNIQDLKQLAKMKFDEAIEHDWNSPAFAHAAELVFSNTSSEDFGLRGTIALTLKRHRELVDYEEVQELLKSGNEMAWAFIQVLHDDQW